MLYLAERNCRYYYLVIFMVKTIYGGGIATIESIYYWRLLGALSFEGGGDGYVCRVRGCS